MTIRGSSFSGSYILVVSLAIGLMAGCGWFTPVTKVSAGPFGSSFTFEDSKDNEILVEGAAANPADNSFRVDRLQIRNVSSSVLAAQTERLVQINEQMRIHGQNIAQAIGEFRGLLGSVMPYVMRAEASSPLGKLSVPAATLEDALNGLTTATAELSTIRRAIEDLKAALEAEKTGGTP